MARLYIRGTISTLIGALAFAALVFGGAGTLNYWQGWLFFAVFEGCSIALGIYLAITNPKLLERRMSAGPLAEKETSQRIIITLVMIGFIALLFVPALDHRFGWSSMPPSVSVAGNALVALSFVIFFYVLRANSYSASTIQVFEGQTVVSIGPYALVRHPMYSGALILLIGIPLALGSWWGLPVAVLFLPVLAWRLIDEERYLAKNLPGYAEYIGKVPYRLVPQVW